MLQVRVRLIMRDFSFAQITPVNLLSVLSMTVDTFMEEILCDFDRFYLVWKNRIDLDEWKGSYAVFSIYG